MLFVNVVPLFQSGVRFYLTGYCDIQRHKQVRVISL